MEFIKRLVKFLLFKIKYSKSQIAYNTNIDIHSKLGYNNKIDTGNVLSSSILKDYVFLSENTVVASSVIDEYTKIHPNTRVINSTIGRCSYVAEESIINYAEIGSFCSIGPRVIIGYGNHPTNFMSTSPLFYSNGQQVNLSFVANRTFAEREKITIGHDVWIGAMVFIADGVSIGDGAVIAAGAVVVTDVPSFAIFGGVPAKFIKTRFNEDVSNYLLKIKWWNWEIDSIKANINSFQKEINKFGDIDAASFSNAQYLKQYIF